MIIDCHYHLETRMQPVENLIQKMDLNGIEKVALVPTMWDVPPHTPEFLLKLLRFVLYHRFFRSMARKMVSNFSPEGYIVLPKKTVKLYKDPENESVSDAIKAYPDRFLGWIFINPKGKNDVIEEYEKWKNQSGFIGVKAHSFWHQFQPEKLAPVAERAAREGKPLLIHVGFDVNGDFEALANEVPELKIILAHAGFPEYSDTWKKIRDHKNIYVDLSADAYVNGKATQQVVEYLGVERCFFGTDGPYGHHADDGMFDNGFIKRRIESLFPGRETRNKLLGDNFRDLIGI